MPANRNKLAFYYFAAAVLLFAAGYGLAWFSDQPFFSKDVFPKSQTAKTAPTATPVPASLDERKPSVKPGRQYTVQSGDTISTIAEQNGLGFEQLAQYNNIPYPYNLTLGQVIVIPNP